jgi:hypothetical protein
MTNSIRTIFINKMNNINLIIRIIMQIRWYKINNNPLIIKIIYNRLISIPVNKCFFNKININKSNNLIKK